MSHTIPVAGQTRALLLPKAGTADVQKQQPKPCVTILIHGVNDLAGVYADIEEGLCAGLNDRLDHLTNAKGQVNAAALNPATYTLPPAKGADTSHPDAIYYRRRASQGKHGGVARSVVIPFYWGYREEENLINKTAPHGEWLDHYGNRLDKAGTKEGGMFANATTTLPDMWGEGFSARLAGAVPMNPLFGTPDHPLLKAPGRKYMLLAAQRLAMLVKMIRSYKSKDSEDTGTNDTINVVAHSQGTMITLLANALLKDDGQRPIDSFVMMNSPYSLVESFFEYGQLFNHQQTTEARLKTLAGIVQFIGEKPNASPALTALADHTQPGCIGGLRWTGAACKTTLDGRELSFTERDNRGRTYLYFSPQDQTVGMSNVQGIGWQGIGDTVSFHFDDPRHAVTPALFAKRLINPISADDHFKKTLPALSALGHAFSQRVFTLRLRNGKPEEVGKAPTYTYVLKYASNMGLGETTWEGTELSHARKYIAGNADLKGGQAVTIAAPALPVTFAADFSAHGARIDSKASQGIAPVRAAADPIDAAISVTNKGENIIATRDLYYGYGAFTVNDSIQRWAEEQAADLNDLTRNPWTNNNQNNDWAADWHRAQVTPSSSGYFRVVYYESPNEAKRRIMEAPLEDRGAYSFHSAIPMNPMHSRRAVAYDVAIGQAKSIDDEAYYAYLCRVADWRLSWGATYGGINTAGDTETDLPASDVLAFYDAEKNKSQVNRQLIDDTVKYRQTGKHPTQMNINMPKLVVSQSVGGRRRGLALQEGGTPPQNGAS